MHRSILAILLLPACGSATLGAKEAESVGLVLQAIEAAALVAEIAQHGVLPEPESEPVCPQVSRISGYVTLDYGDGCVPDSGWVAGAVSGTTRLDLGSDEVTADLAEMAAGGVALDGELSARPTPVSDLVVDLELDTDDPDELELAVTVGLGQAPPLRMDGTAQRNAGGVGNPMTLAGLVVPVPDGDCFAPTAGTATVESGIYSLSLTFEDDGTTSVVRSDDAEGSVDTCAGIAPLFAD